MKTSNRQMQGGSSGMHPERRTVIDSIGVDVLPPTYSGNSNLSQSL